MNKDDLLALVWSSTSGWMPSSDRELSRTPKGRAHQRLLALVQQSGSSRKAIELLRRRLIQEINHTSRGLLEDALGCIDALKGSYYAIEAPANPAVRIPPLPFDLVPPSSSAREALSLTLALRRLTAIEQIEAIRLSEAYEDLGNLEHEAYSLVLVHPLEQDEGLSHHERAADSFRAAPSEENVIQLRAELNKRHIRVTKMWARLTPRTKALLNEEQYDFPACTTHTTRALAVQIPLHATDMELQEVSRWTRMVGASMYRPLPVDDSCGKSQARAFQRAWGQYKECGHGLQLLSVWAQSMASTSEAQRCEICYRHIAADARRFCKEHKRRAEIRQETRDLHVSRFYKPMALKDIRVSQSSTAKFGQWTRSTATMNRMRKIAVSQGVHEDVVQSAADLATTLRSLKPFLRPVVTEQLAQVFRGMLELAQQPYLEKSNGDRARDLELNKARAQAPLWLSWSNLVGYMFGFGMGPSWSTRPFRGFALDAAHPINDLAPVLPSKVAVDLLHVGAWQTVDEVLNDYLYVDRDTLLRLRSAAAEPGRHAMSLVQIGRKVGASHETVRQNLARAEGRPARTSDRRRTVASGAQRLRQELGIEDVPM